MHQALDHLVLQGTKWRQCFPVDVPLERGRRVSKIHIDSFFFLPVPVTLLSILKGTFCSAVEKEAEQRAQGPNSWQAFPPVTLELNELFILAEWNLFFLPVAMT